VCISNTVASGGEIVAPAVAEQLGFRYCDQEILEVAAAKAGLDVDVLAEAERHQSLVKRLVEMAGLSKIVSDPLAYLTRAPLEEQYY
jgi:hypothetical protein